LFERSLLSLLHQTFSSLLLFASLSSPLFF
jgi:hypothetical protein